MHCSSLCRLFVDTPRAEWRHLSSTVHQSCLTNSISICGFNIQLHASQHSKTYDSSFTKEILWQVLIELNSNLFDIMLNRPRNFEHDSLMIFEKIEETRESVQISCTVLVTYACVEIWQLFCFISSTNVQLITLICKPPARRKLKS
jgi:hypothetical protein